MKLKEKYPTAKVELWCEDEHRLGLKPIIRKVWSPVGQRPSVKVHQRYEWTYLYAFARPNSGEVHWLIVPTVSAQAFSVALENFAKEVGAGKRKRILLVVEHARRGRCIELFAVLSGRPTILEQVIASVSGLPAGYFRHESQCVQKRCGK